MSVLTRQIYTPGDAMLPPSADPIPPANMPRNERYVVYPPVDHPLDSSEWYRFRSAQQMPRELLNAQWINEPEWFPRYYGNGKGLKGCPPPIWRVKGKASRYPDFWMRGSLYALSPRLKAVIEEHAPGVLDTLPLRIETMEGELIRDDYCVIDVILSVKGIDWANSIVAYEYMLGGVVPSPSKIVMRDEVSGLKIFRDVHRPTHVFIHKSLYDAIFSLKPKVTGTYFTQVW